MEIVIIVLLGFILDLIFGDPQWLPHPICLIGNLIKGMEKVLRRIFPKSGKGEFAAGVVLCIVVPLLSFIVPFLILKVLAQISPWLARVCEVIFCYQIFAGKSLKDQSMRVHKYIEAEDLPNSRKYLSWIVGRDTAELNFKQITKAVIETVAENASDGVIAPMLFMIIGGAPLGFLYKGVNTLDSMVGYKNEKYINFGKCSAIVDDVFNFIPARITGIAMCAAAALVKLDGKNAWKIFKRDRHNHASPNSANPESAAAGALCVQLAGDAYYFGKLYKKKTIGDDIRPVEAADIPRTCRLMYAASVLCMIVFETARLVLVVIL